MQVGVFVSGTGNSHVRPISGLSSSILRNASQLGANRQSVVTVDQARRISILRVPPGDLALA
jgi:hypothetical protein